jgi:nitrite reductase/ring-hydroxylating ferredoxin subunit
VTAAEGSGGAAVTGASGNTGRAVGVAPSSNRYNVGRVSEIPDGGRRLVEIGGRSIGVFNVGGRFFALRNRCAHQGGPLCQGRVFACLHSERPGEYRYEHDRYLLECPWHGWEFDMATGQSWFDPQRTRVRRYPVSVQTVRSDAACALAPGPYRVESYPVAVEEECVIVELGG